MKQERLMDLVRYARHHLFEEGVISDEEFAALVADSDSGQRVARLEEYDSLRAEIARLTAELVEVREQIEAVCSDAEVVGYYGESAESAAACLRAACVGLTAELAKAKQANENLLKDNSALRVESDARRAAELKIAAELAARTEERNAALQDSEQLDRLYERAKTTIRPDIQSVMDIIPEYEALRKKRNEYKRGLDSIATAVYPDKDPGFTYSAEFVADEIQRMKANCDAAAERAEKAERERNGLAAERDRAMELVVRCCEVIGGSPQQPTDPVFIVQCIDALAARDTTIKARAKAEGYKESLANPADTEDQEQFDKFWAHVLNAHQDNPMSVGDAYRVKLLLDKDRFGAYRSIAQAEAGRLEKEGEDHA